jgi:hypothetical protein
LTAIPFTTLPKNAREQGFNARQEGVPLRRNPYDATIHPDQYKAWSHGWREIDEEICLLNLAAVVQEFLEQMEDTGAGTFAVNEPILAVLRHAAKDASRFV